MMFAQMWGLPWSWGYPNSWMVYKMDDLEVPLFQETSMCTGLCCEVAACDFVKLANIEAVASYAKAGV